MAEHRIVRLKEPGEKATLRVTRVTYNAGADYPDYTFAGTLAETDEPVWVNVPKAATERQLDRLGYTDPQRTVGRLFTFKREANAKVPTKPFWAIYEEHPGDDGPMPGDAPPPVAASRATPPQGTPAQAPPAPAVEDRIDHRYVRVTQFVLDQVVPEYTSRGLTVTAEAAAAMTATLWIQLNKER